MAPIEEIVTSDVEVDQEILDDAAARKKAGCCGGGNIGGGNICKASISYMNKTACSICLG